MSFAASLHEPDCSRGESLSLSVMSSDQLEQHSACMQKTHRHAFGVSPELPWERRPLPSAHCRVDIKYGFGEGLEVEGHT